MFFISKEEALQELKDCRGKERCFKFISKRPNFIKFINTENRESILLPLDSNYLTAVRLRIRGHTCMQIAKSLDMKYYTVQSKVTQEAMRCYFYNLNSMFFSCGRYLNIDTLYSNVQLVKLCECLLDMLHPHCSEEFIKEKKQILIDNKSL